MRLNIITDEVRQANLNTALARADAGFPVFPCRPDKRPLVKDWQARATADKARLRHWWRRWPDAMPGLPTGARSGLAVMDIDRKSGRDGVAALEAMGLDPLTLSPVVVETPSDGLHAYFRWSEGMGNSATGLPPGVDVRGEGGYVIAPGAVSPKGRYTASGGDLDALRLIGPEMLPHWPEALRPRAPERPSDAMATPGSVPLATLRDALHAIPNTEDNPDAHGRDWWLGKGMAVAHATGGSAEGAALWHEWSGIWPGYDADATEAAWQSFRRRDGALRTWATIRTEAERHGWHDLRAFDSIPTADELAEIDSLIADPPADAPTRPKGRLTFKAPAECGNVAARPYVLKGLLAGGDVAAIVGAPGVGKSLIGPRVAFGVAQGGEVFGMRTRRGRVFYVAAEDEHGMDNRVAALRDEYGDAPDFRLVGGVTSLFPDSPDLAALRAAVKAERPALIVIDTVAMAFPGLKENEADAMGRVVAAARSLTKWGAAVVLIHHDTKEGGGLPRGHSILNGALDMSLHLTREGGIVRGRPTKNRNGSADIDVAFTIGTRVVGVDSDGEDVTAAFASDLDASAAGPKIERLNSSALAALDILARLLEGGEPVTESIWRKSCTEGREVSGSDNAKSRATAFTRAVQELTRKDRVEISPSGFVRRILPRIDASERFPDAWPD
ncbi:MAG: bifunctional DNA primase/polymerase [Pararhodobacter sp.]